MTTRPRAVQRSSTSGGAPVVGDIAQAEACGSMVCAYLRRLGWGVVLAGVVSAAGCSGHAQVALIPLSTAALAPNSQLEYRFSPQQCYWWADDDGNLNLAMSYQNFSIAGDYTRDALELSFVLDAPPPDLQHDYKARRDTARGIWHRGGWHLRMRPRRGVISVTQHADESLRGQFRLICSTEKFWILTGWQRQSSVVLQGDFTAVLNEEKGLVILERSESGDLRGQGSGGVTFEPGG